MYIMQRLGVVQSAVRIAEGVMGGMIVIDNSISRKGRESFY